MKTPIAVLVLLLFGSHLVAQNQTFFGYLAAISQTGKINQKWNYNLFISTTVDAFDQIIDGEEFPASNLQLYVQPSIIFIHSPTLNLAGSYTYQRSHPFNNRYVNEHRLWQQLIFSIPLFQGKWTNRFRLEERFIQNRNTNEYPLATRFRYQVGFKTPLKGRKLDEKEFYFSTYNEFYFSLTGKKNATYSGNWSYASFGYYAGKSGKFELGYLLQIGTRNLQKDKRFLNLVQVMWSTNFAFFQKRIQKK